MGKAALVLPLLLLAAAASAQEAEPEDKRKVRNFESVDVFWSNNVNDAFLQDAQSAGRVLVAQGYDAANATVHRQAAVGGRFGLLFPVKSGDWFDLDAGASVGYISGPNSKSVVSGYSTVLGDGTIVTERTLKFARFLTEIRLIVPFSKRWALHLGAGAGAAIGRERVACSGTGSLNAACAYNTASASWTGFSGEGSSSLAYTINATNLMLGFRYAGFPSYPGSSRSSRIVWTAPGFFAGAVLPFE